MKKAIAYFILFVVFTSGSLYAEMESSLKLDKASKTAFLISSKTNAGFSGLNSIESIGLSDFQTPEGLFTKLEIEGYSKNYGTEGFPHLPVLTSLIEIPYGATVKINIKAYDSENFSLAKKGANHHIAPMQPSASKNISKDKVKFCYNPVSYKVDAFNNDPLVTFEDIGIMRGVRFGRLKIAPIRYNPFQNIVKVMNNISFDLSFENPETAFTEKMKKKYFSPLFKSSLNLAEKLPSSKDAIADVSGWPVTYLIIAHASFKGNTGLNDFITWKRQSGFNVIDVYTDDPAVGSTKTSIKSYLENLYKNSSTIPSYALLIGDVDKIPAWSGITDTHVTDLYYFTYDGSSDYIPDLYYGRFPADNNTELSAIISKTLQYEKYDFESDTESDYLNNYMFIAGADADYASSYGNAQLNYLTKEYFSANTDSEIYKYLYSDISPYSSWITDAIIENFNSGVGFVNYTGHCGADGWSNGSSYDFESDDLDSLSKENKYAFIIGNCCLSNKFDNDDCFGEKILKEPNAGAIAYIGASNSTYWDEDFYWSVGEPDLALEALNASEHTISNTEYGAYDGLFHKAKAQADWYITAGQIIHCGNLAVTNTASQNVQYYWEIYHLMGDPSLMPYLEEPLAVLVSPVISPIRSCLTREITISDVEENSYVAFSQDGVLLDSAYSGTNTSVSLNFAAIDSDNGDGMIVVTKQNKQPYINGAINILQEGVAALPVADFTSNVEDIYSGTTIIFNNLSTGCGNTYSWYFVDDSVVSSIEDNPAVIYQEIGIFNVRLDANNTGGSNSKTEFDYIKVLPKIKANSASGIIKDGKCEIEFSELSTNQEDITLWEWKFPGGNIPISQETNPVVVYTTPGLYTASLDVTVNGVIYTSNLLNIEIKKALPVASFTLSPATIIAGEAVYFSDTSQNEVDRWEWKFAVGEPQSSTKQNPVVSYPTEGTHSATLTVFNTTGFDRKKITFIVNQAAKTPPDSDGSGGGSCFIETSVGIFN